MGCGCLTIPLMAKPSVRPPGSAATSSVATTRGIRVSVESRYVPQHSSTREKRYSFAYHVEIKNESKETLQLWQRHWIITHEDGTVEEVRGQGVVGEQPVLEPGQSFAYTSGCTLPSPRGTMEGTYEFRAGGNPVFLAEIGRFALELPYSLN